MMVADTVLPSSQVADVRLIPDKKLIRAGLLMLLFMTAAFGAETWSTMQDLAIQVKAVPLVLFVTICFLVARLYPEVNKIAAPDLAAPERSVGPLQITELAQVSREIRSEIWNYWDENGTGREKIEYVRNTYGMPANVVQRLLERYDVRWRKQVAVLYSDNPGNEYTVYAGIDPSQIADDALRIKSGLPIYPIAGVWLCSDCRKRPCRCR